MEEAEALSQKIAILVSGELKCIGNQQYLKDKFGKGYELEIKLDDESDGPNPADQALALDLPEQIKENDVFSTLTSMCADPALVQSMFG